MTSGTPRSLVITPDEVREALSGVVGQIVDGARECLAEAPAELAHDVLETGLFLTGGGALLRGLDMRLARDCEVPVHVTEQPLHTVALGAGRLLEYLPDFRSAFFATSKAEHRPRRATFRQALLAKSVTNLTMAAPVPHRIPAVTSDRNTMSTTIQRRPTTRVTTPRSSGAG